MSAIIKELRDKGWKDDEVRGIVRHIDREVEGMQRREREMAWAVTSMGIGAVLFIGGLVSTILFTVWMNTEGRWGYFICYGAVLSGGSAFWYGWAWRKRLLNGAPAASDPMFRSRFKRGDNGHW
jgi:hypothetical protein